ncbi:MAG: hypothetical protein ACOC8H_00830 [bacterium]
MLKRLGWKLLWRLWRRCRRYEHALDKIIDGAPRTRPDMWVDTAERHYRTARWRDAQVARRAINEARHEDV